MKYWMLVLTFVAGCSQSGQLAINDPQLSDAEIELARAKLTYLTVLESDKDQDEPATDCACGGTRRSGDGLGPCECIASGKPCKCSTKCGNNVGEHDPPEEKPDVFQLLCVTGDPQDSTQSDRFHCTLCERWSRNQRPSLEAAGWTFGDDPDADARMINFRDFKSKFGEDITSLPVFAVTKNGELITRSILKGYHTGQAVADHVNAFRLGKELASNTSRSESTPKRLVTRYVKQCHNGKCSMVKVTSWE